MEPLVHVAMWPVRQVPVYNASDIVSLLQWTLVISKSKGLLNTSRYPHLDIIRFTKLRGKIAIFQK